MLTASAFNEPVNGIVGVIVSRLDAAVAEIDGLLGIVANVGDVACRVVGVMQVLKLATGPAGRPAVAGNRRERRACRAGSADASSGR